MKILKMIGIIIVLILTVIAVTCKMFAENLISRIKNKFSTVPR